MISVRNQKRLLTIAAFVLSSSLFAAAQRPFFPPPPPPPPPTNHGCNGWSASNCKPAAVPDGGSTLVYVLGVGAISLAAIFVRSREAKNEAV
jgi:hypothetical protein